MRTLLFALVPALALAAPAAGARRISTLLIAMDPAAESSRVQLEGYLNEALGRAPRYTVRQAEELMGLPWSPQALAARKKAERTLQEGRAEFDSKKDDAAAERKLRAAVQELGKAASALSACASLCDAIALYAAALHRRGDVEEAKLILVDLIALNPSYDFKPPRFSRELAALRAQVATGRMATLRGELQVTTQPGGARVFVDGELKGFSPLQVSALRVGKHLVRLERPGYLIRGEVVEVTPDETELAATLAATPSQREHAAQLEAVAGELARKSPSPAGFVTLGTAFGLENGLVGTVRTLGGGSELVVGLFDLRTGKRLASQKRVLQGDEFGQLRAEAGRIVNQLLAQSQGGGEKRVQSEDPLDNRHGTEEWSHEDQGGRTRAAEKKKRAKQDPLDGISGTEDW